jgi:hypothetical protein
MTVACAALVVALGGTGYPMTALPKNSVGTAQLRDGAVTGAKVKDRSISSADLAGMPAARVVRSASQDMGTTGETAIRFDSVEFSTRGMFDPSRPDRLTIRTAGTYSVVGSVLWEPGSSGDLLGIAIVRNGRIQAERRDPATPSGVPQQVLDITRLRAGDIVELRGYHTTGTPLAIRRAALAAYWLGH